MALISRIKSAWNAFFARDENKGYKPDANDYSYSYRPDRFRSYGGNEKSIVTSIYTRMAIDAANLQVHHVKTNDMGVFQNNVNSSLDWVFSVSANQDQTPRAFFQDAVYSLLDEGSIAIVPIDADREPYDTDSYDIYSLRVGKIVEWRSKSVRVSTFNARTGMHEYLLMPKHAVALVENPFYSIMNEPNSTLQRLKRKLALLDVIDEKAASKKLDLIIQLPYMVRSEYQQQQANRRVHDIEDQLANSQWGIAYTDGTEHITQLNRPVENNLLSQVDYLTKMLYSQLSITEEIMNGTASPDVMNNYYNRTIGPIMSAIVDEMKRKFLTKTALTQKQSIQYFIDPFKLLTISSLATVSDSLTKNQIMTSNEFRGVIALPPSDDPQADQLRNPNINPVDSGSEEEYDPAADEFNSMLDDLEGQIDSILNGGTGDD